MSTSLSVGGAKVDVIKIDPGRWDDVADVGDLQQRAFVAGQMWAYESATSMTMHLAEHRLRLLVARPAGLLGGKLAAALSSSRNPRKRASDAADTIGLLRHPTVLVGDEPLAFLTTVRAAMDRVLRDPTEVARLATTGGIATTADEVDVLAQLYERELSRAIDASGQGEGESTS